MKLHGKSNGNRYSLFGNRGITRIVLAIAATALIAGSIRLIEAEGAALRFRSDRCIRFSITTMEISQGKRRILNRSEVDGPPGVDFEITLGYGMNRIVANFRTFPDKPERMDVEARFNSQRHYGTSSNGHPLYEMIEKTQSITVASGESFFFYPYGRDTAGEQLVLEILPEVSPRPSTDSLDLPVPIQIDPGDLQQVQLDIRATPGYYLFQTTMRVVSGETEVGRGETTLRLEKPGQLEVPFQLDGRQHRLRLTVTAEKATIRYLEFRVERGTLIEGGREQDCDPIIRYWGTAGHDVPIHTKLPSTWCGIDGQLLLILSFKPLMPEIEESNVSSSDHKEGMPL